LFDNPQTAYTRELVEAVPHIETGLALISTVRGIISTAAKAD